MALEVTVAPPGVFLLTFTFFDTVFPDTVTAPAPLLTVRSAPICVLVMLTAPDEPLTVASRSIAPPLTVTEAAPAEWRLVPIEAPLSFRVEPLDRFRLPLMMTPDAMVQDW